MQVLAPGSRISMPGPPTSSALNNIVLSQGPPRSTNSQINVMQFFAVTSPGRGLGALSPSRYASFCVSVLGREFGGACPTVLPLCETVCAFGLGISDMR